MKTYKNTFRINAEPEDVYSALTNPVTIELWSGYPAVFSEEAGTEFSMWEGDIQGMIIETKKNRKLVEEWYFGDQEEKSIAVINISADNNKTVLSVEHSNIPDSKYANISEGL